MTLNLAGKKFLITGAGKGIGREIAKTLHQQGSKVNALSRLIEPLKSLVSENPGIQPIHADVGKLETLFNKLEGIDVLGGLVNNAAQTGIPLIGALGYPREELHSLIDSQVLGLINATQIVAKKMVAAGKHGSIVNVSSIWSKQVVPGQLAYTMTKAAVDMITKQFALELGPHNIRVNAVNPTLVLTEKVTRVIKEGVPLDEIFIERTPNHRICKVHEIALPVLYLLSDLSTTTNIINGGMMSSYCTSFDTKKT
ncbi:carbonyl reductase [NADPH] 2-like [Mya arenaria]|uniref:carbonyl reductase [NADPH] 2-like n=1 Tax=Mya arenaria TaxID=6604 RepID=UPI0022E0AAB9|nr:carbonyl reductase [NADPH] 2-like [Mya arenaria]